MTIPNATMKITGRIAATVTGLPSGPAFLIQSPTNLTAPGSAPATWDDSANGATMIDVADYSVAGLGPSLNTVAYITEGMRSTDLSALPAGTGSSFSAAICCDYDQSAPGYCGIGWGAAATRQAFIPGINNLGQASLDFYGSRIVDPAGVDVRASGGVVISADYDYTTRTARLFKNGVFLVQTTFSVSQALNIGTSFINLLITFGGIPSAAWVGGAGIWPYKFSDAQHLQTYDHWNDRYIRDIRAPLASSGPTLGGATETSLTYGFTPDESGSFWPIVTTVLGTPSATQIKNGRDSSDSLANYAAGETSMERDTPVSGVATPLASDTPHFFYAVLRDVAGKERVISYTNGGAGVSTTDTAAADVVLTSGVIAATSQTTAVGSVTASALGTLYKMLTDTFSEPSAGTIIAAAAAQPISATGSQAVGFSGLTANSTKYAWVVGVNLDGVAGSVEQLVGPGTNGAFTTDAAGTVTSLTPDQTATSASDLISKLTNWQNNWSTTTPAGKSNSDDRVMGIAFNISSQIDLRSCLNFAVSAGRQRVTLRMVGTFAKTGTGDDTIVNSPYTWDADVLANSVNVKNVRFTRMKFKGARRLKIYSSTDVQIDHCYMQGAYGDPKTAAGTPTQDYAFSITGTVPTSADPISNYPLPTTGLVFEHNLLQGYSTALLMLFGNAPGMVFRGNLADISGHDNFKFHAGDHTDMLCENNWGSRWFVSGGDPHIDFNQNVKGDYTGATFRGEVQMIGRTFGTAGGAYQGYFFAPEGTNSGPICSGVTWSDFIQVGNNKGIHHSYTGTGNVVGNCTTLVAFDKNPNSSDGCGLGLKAGSKASFSKNVASVADAVGDAAAGQGAGGVRLNWGSPTSLSQTAVLQHFAAAHLSTSMIESLIPKTTSPMHWNYGTESQRIGAWRRLKEIFVDGIHPENEGWPVAPIWRARWNANASPLVPTTYTGRFDSDGNNA